MNFVNQLQTAATASSSTSATVSSSKSTAKDQPYSNEGSQSKNQNTSSAEE